MKSLQKHLKAHFLAFMFKTLTLTQVFTTVFGLSTLIAFERVLKVKPVEL